MWKEILDEYILLLFVSMWFIYNWKAVYKKIGWTPSRNLQHERSSIIREALFASNLTCLKLIEGLCHMKSCILLLVCWLISIAIDTFELLHQEARLICHSTTNTSCLSANYSCFPRHSNSRRLWNFLEYVYTRGTNIDLYRNLTVVDSSSLARQLKLTMMNRTPSALEWKLFPSHFKCIKELHY